VWKGLSIGRAVFSLLAWVLFSIFIRKDETYSSLEKREFSLLDDIAVEATPLQKEPLKADLKV
jgi:hypothetical protein